MPEIFFTSDLHFGHKNVIRYDNRPFANVDEMDEAIITRWNQRVSDADTVYVLGDVSWYNLDRTREYVCRLRGHKHLIVGNHDRIRPDSPCGFESVREYAKLYPDKNTQLVLSHYPIHFFDRHHYGAIMLYGHVHNSQEWNVTLNWQRELQRLGITCNMYNVGTMIWGYKPVTLDEIINDTRFLPVPVEMDGETDSTDQ